MNCELAAGRRLSVALKGRASAVRKHERAACIRAEVLRFWMHRPEARGACGPGSHPIKDGMEEHQLRFIFATTNARALKDDSA